MTSKAGFPLACITAVTIAIALGIAESADKSSNPPGEAAPVANKTESPVPWQAAIEPAASTAPSTASGTAPPSTDGAPVQQRMFRMRYEDGRCSLDATIDVAGNFPRERVHQWQTGMWACRLHDATGQVLAERTLHAPDYNCVVLDPNDPSGKPAAARFTAKGPVVFQVRFPILPEATRIDVIRITTETRPAIESDAGGQVLASIPLPSK